MENLKKFDARLRKVRHQQSLKNLPSFLINTPKRRWASMIASGIHLELLEKCCNTGCVMCNFIGWKRCKVGNIIDIMPPVYSTSEYGELHGLSYKTVARQCDEGIITSFKIPGSKHRYIVCLT